MKARALFALLAILPAAFSAAIPARAHGLTVVLCSGRTIELPVNRMPGAPADDTPCCAKACHTGQSRKRAGACH